MILPPPFKVETVHEIILKPDLSRFCVCFCIEKSTPLFSLCLRATRTYVFAKFIDVARALRGALECTVPRINANQILTQPPKGWN